MTDPTRPTLDHEPRCDRRGAPLLCHDLLGAPVFICPTCQATAPADDTRPARTPQDAPRGPLSHADAATDPEPAPTRHNPERTQP